MVDMVDHLTLGSSDVQTNTKVQRPSSDQPVFNTQGEAVFLKQSVMSGDQSEASRYRPAIEIYE